MCLFIKEGRRYIPAPHTAIIGEAAAIYEALFPDTVALTSPDTVREYLKYSIGTAEREQFVCIYLNNQHKVIANEVLFSGTIDGASVYPRIVVKQCLEHNAAAVILAHNHPSGMSEPSFADRSITEKIKTALDTVDIRVLDHLIVGSEIYSFAEHGLI